MTTTKALSDSATFISQNIADSLSLNNKLDRSTAAGNGGAALIGTAGGITVEAAIGNKTDSAVFSTAISSLSAGINAKVIDALGASTTIAPSQNAVSTALALKANTSDLTTITTLISAILNGTAIWTLPDEANGDAIPAAGSKKLYLSAGVLKIA